MTVQSPRRPRLSHAVAGALAVAALAAPTADARPYEEFFGSTSARSEQQAEAPAPTVTRTVEEGFDWGSAAIGAGGAAAVLLLAGAGASAVSHRHQRLGVVR